MHKHFSLSVLLLSLCLGCGKGGGPPDLVGPAEDLPGTRVSFRVPTCMTLLPDGTDAKRAKPLIPFQIPGMQQRTYEGFVKDGVGSEIPFYCHVLVVATPKAPGQDVSSQLRSAMSKIPGNAPALTDFLAVSPEGKESKWQMMRLPAATNEFYCKDKAGKETYKPLNAIGEMYLHEEAGFSVMIAWRLPEYIEKNVGNVGLAELAKATAGGVTVRPQ